MIDHILLVTPTLIGSNNFTVILLKFFGLSKSFNIGIRFTIVEMETKELFWDFSFCKRSNFCSIGGFMAAFLKAVGT